MKQNYGSVDTSEQEGFTKKQIAYLKKITVLNAIWNRIKKVLCFCFEEKKIDDNFQINVNNSEKTTVINHTSLDTKVSHNQFIFRSSRPTSVEKDESDTALGSSIDSKGIFSFSDPELSDNLEELLSPGNSYYLNSPNSDSLGNYPFFYSDANLHHVNEADF